MSEQLNNSCLTPTLWLPQPKNILVVGIVLLALNLFVSNAYALELGSGYSAHNLDSLCYRGMVISSLGNGSGLTSRLFIPESPYEGDGFVLHVKFSTKGMCENKVSFRLKLHLSSGLMLVGKPASKGTKALIEKGKWPNSEWVSDLMWSLRSIKGAYKNRQWVVIELINNRSQEVILGGKVYVDILRPRAQYKISKYFVKKDFKGIYIDSPDDIESMNENYGVDFKGGKGETAFDNFATLDIHYVVVNNIAKFFSEHVDSNDQNILKNESIKFIHYIKRVRPDIKIWFAVPSWRFDIPGSSFNKLVAWINTIDDIDGMVLDWETTPSMFSDVPSVFQFVRKLLDKDKTFICTPTSFIGRRGLNWNDVDSKHLGCDLFLPMFYVPQQDDLLITAKAWLDSWIDPKNKPSSPIIPLLIPIHKATDNTPMPSSLMRYTVDLIARYNLPGFFVYRPYAITPQVRDLLSQLFGDFDVDFGLENIKIASDGGKIKVVGNIVNYGATKFFSPIPIEVILFDNHRMLKKITMNVTLYDGKRGKLDFLLGKKAKAITKIIIRLDPIEKYIPRPLKLNGQEIFSMSPKEIDIPEIDEMNNKYIFTKKGIQWCLGQE